MMTRGLKWFWPPPPAVAATLIAASCSGCQRAHSALAPATPEAESIAKIGWIFFAVCAVVYGAVIFVVLAVARKHRTPAALVSPAPLRIVEASERRTHRILAAATVGTSVILLGLLVADLSVQRRLQAREDDPLTIRLTGHQWWWAAEYQHAQASEVFETTNELHVPIGRSIRILLESNDVIHSFWVPQLQGKRDLVPGHPTSLSFAVEKTGRFEGLCAEFCGLQHAHMGLLVVAEDPAQFSAWAQTQRSLAPEPANDRQRRGREIFERATCATCHTVHGSAAHSRVGPVLTHLASQETLGAGVLTNTREHLRDWILDPNRFKPGVRMPANPLSNDDLNALLDYLETLK